jgi:DNA ligase-1
MNRFADLLDRLVYEPGRNNKLRLITDYFRNTPDPERGFALAALTGALSFRHAKPNIIRTLISERSDPVLFALSYDYVGDLSETVALMWPVPHEKTPLLVREKGRATARDDGSTLHLVDPPAPVPSAPFSPTPSLSEVVMKLSTLGRSELPRQLAAWLDALDETGRWALLKLVTGALRIGVSARLAKTAAAALGDKDPQEIELIWPGLKPP